MHINNYAITYKPNLAIIRGTEIKDENSQETFLNFKFLVMSKEP